MVNGRMKRTCLAVHGRFRSAGPAVAAADVVDALTEQHELFAAAAVLLAEVAG